METKRATALPLDSSYGLTARDSARLVTLATKLASEVPGDTAAQFRGLPYVLGAVRRFRLAPDTVVLIVEAIRHVNQEATPLEERIFLIAEGREQGAFNAQLEYFERSRGSEDGVEGLEVLAAVLLGQEQRPALILMRDANDRTAYSLLERSAKPSQAPTWKRRWTSPYMGC